MKAIPGPAQDQLRTGVWAFFKWRTEEGAASWLEMAMLGNCSINYYLFTTEPLSEFNDCKLNVYSTKLLLYVVILGLKIIRF